MAKPNLATILRLLGFEKRQLFEALAMLSGSSGSAPEITTWR
jgi:hypothetical protein